MPAISLAPIREQWPGYLIAQERDSFYWLRDTDIDRARTILNIDRRQHSIGYDQLTWTANLATLLKASIPVAIV